MPESIQNRCSCAIADPTDAARRLDFLAHAAAVFGRPLAVGLDDRGLAQLDDTGALLLAFPWLSDAELTEALWALRHF
jgi:hypothetical protein